MIDSIAGHSTRVVETAGISSIGTPKAIHTTFFRSSATAIKLSRQILAVIATANKPPNENPTKQKKLYKAIPHSH